ncbi:MAG: hypothetical protein NVS9B4_11120 [Candidatus Acidiferrum sp.]
MLLSDLLFIILFLTAVSTLLLAAWFGARKQFGPARGVLCKLLIANAIYILVLVVVSLVLPRRIVKPGDPQCFDDWCVGVAGFDKKREGSVVAYRVDLRLFSRARRVSQRENHLAVYLTDERGRRFDSIADKMNVPFNVLLRPEESVVVSRSFVVPDDAREVGAVITHEGGFPIGWFIVGYDAWFRKPPLVRFL